MKIGDLLTSAGLRSKADLSKIPSWTRSAHHDFLNALREIVEPATYDVIGRRTIESDLRLYTESQFAMDVSLIRRSTLYGSTVVVPLYAPIPPDAYAPSALQREVARVAAMLIALEPFVREGLVTVVQPLISGPEGNRFFEYLHDVRRSDAVDQLVNQRRVVIARHDTVTGHDQERGDVTVTGRYIRADFDNVRGHHFIPDVPVETRSSMSFGFYVSEEGCVPVPPTEVVNDGELAEVAESVVARRLSAILNDWVVATGAFKASVVTGSDVAWTALREIERKRSGQAHYPTAQAVVELDLPFLDCVEPGVIAHERERNRESFDRFRRALDSYAVEAGKVLKETSDPRALAALRSKHIDEPLADIEKRVESAAKANQGKNIAGIVLGLSTAVALLHSAPAWAAVLTAFASSTGGAALLNAKSDLERVEVEARYSPMHFLWRLKKSVA